MPLVIHPRVRKFVARVAALTSLAIFGGAGAAFAACPAQPVSTPFSHWGDDNLYFAVPGGTFQGTAAQIGWSLDNASLTAGGPTGADETSLTIDGNGSATSPWFCVDNTMPSFRFFAKEDAPGSDLLVEGVVRLPWGTRTFTYPVAEIRDGSMSSWGLVAPITVATAKLPNGTTLPVEIRFVVPGGSGSWSVDDVYIDPYRLG